MPASCLILSRSRMSGATAHQLMKAAYYGVRSARGTRVVANSLQTVTQFSFSWTGRVYDGARPSTLSAITALTVESRTTHTKANLISVLVDNSSTGWAEE